MVILGIDPGTATTGYGVIRVIGNRFQPLDYGVILTEAHMPMERRLEKIHYDIGALIEKWKPDHAAIEELFFNQNITTAISVGQARGVLLLGCALHNLPVYEYTPLQVKQALVGYGRADKNQIQQMVKVFLGLTQKPRPDDAADGLAIAICHAHYYQTSARRIRND